MGSGGDAVEKPTGTTEVVTRGVWRPEEGRRQVQSQAGGIRGPSQRARRCGNPCGVRGQPGKRTGGGKGPGQWRGSEHEAGETGERAGPLLS